MSLLLFMALMRRLRREYRAARGWQLLPERWRAKMLRARGSMLSPCWVWIGWNSANGYGKLKRGGRAMMAHRAVYEAIVGPIPAGLVLDHRCKNRACCNPAHLAPVTPRENTRRGAAILFEPKACAEK